MLRTSITGRGPNPLLGKLFGHLVGTRAGYGFHPYDIGNHLLYCSRHIA